MKPFKVIAFLVWATWLALAILFSKTSVASTFPGGTSGGVDPDCAVDGGSSDA